MRFIKSKGFFIMLAVLVCLIIRHILCISSAFHLPDYQKNDISYIEGGSMNKAQYEDLFMQTGLSPAAADDFIESGDFGSIYALQDGFFEKSKFDKNYIAFPITAEERKPDLPTKMAKLKNGDILVTFNTHTLDWRHGHLGLVTDAEHGIILEHASLGNTSCLSHSSSWGRYPAFAVLRYPDGEIAQKAADFARERLVDIGYSIFAGLKNKDKSNMEQIDSSHCSHIVWQAYMAVGEDIDSNGGRIVTPRDVAMCDKLEAVQIFGLNAEEYKERICRNE